LVKEKEKSSLDSFTHDYRKSGSKQVIATLKFANSYLSRLKGLMFKKKLDHVLVLKPKSNFRVFSSIHTLFMNFSIDLIFLDKNKKVVEIAQVFPWKLYIPKRSAGYILEMKSGSVEKYQIAIGDNLDFVCEFR